MLDHDAHARALDAYRGYNDSPLQRRLRQAAPVLVGAVYWNPQRDCAERIRYELQRIRETGFTFVRFHCTAPKERDDGSWDFSYPDLRFDLAHEVGLGVYPHFSFMQPSRVALAQAGLTPAQAKELGYRDERVAAAIRRRSRAILEHYKDHPAILAYPLSGEPGTGNRTLATEGDRADFRRWLQEHYPDPAAVHRAWLIYPDVDAELHIQEGKELLRIATWDDAVRIAAGIAPRQAGAALAVTAFGRHELFGANRDITRFRADATSAKLRWVAEQVKEVDPDRPCGHGAHQFFYAAGELAWDQHQGGRQGDFHTASIHPSWHFESVRGELERPHYIQSRLTADIFKGGYTNAYETVGGPVQYSGGYGNHMDADLMRKLMLQFLAAGNEGSAFWSWTWRPGGIEAGEYGLLSLSGRVTPWAEEAGRIATAMERYRQEIWHWEIDPELGILRSWDTETVLTCEPRRHDLQDGPTPWSRGPAQQHVRAWIGAGRAAIDGQVDFQYLVDDEILGGLAEVYPAIMLPHARCMSDALLERLLAYVEAGGRLIADVQCAFEDQWGKIRVPGPGSLQHRLFGAWIDAIHDARTRPLALDGVDCPGFYGNLVTDGARVLRRFDNGAPAVSEYRFGRGSATLIACDIARACWQDPDPRLVAILADCYRGPAPRRYHCAVPTSYRRRHGDADHYFIVNDGPARSTVLRVYDACYDQVEDVLGGTTQPGEGSIAVDVPAYGGIWLRCRRA